MVSEVHGHHCGGVVVVAGCLGTSNATAVDWRCLVRGPIIRWRTGAAVGTIPDHSFHRQPAQVFGSPTHSR